MALLDAMLLDPAPFEVWISQRTDGIKGCGTIADPYDGSTQPRFDAAMQAIATQFEDHPVAIHLGPGQFETKGYPTSGGWQIQAGMRIMGSGMDSTTLKLVDGTTLNSFVIGHDLSDSSRADFAEVSDLTIDCNLPNVSAFTIIGAVRLMGEQVKIRRVKAVGWGAQAGGPCLVFSVLPTSPESTIPELARGGIEDCVVVEPAAGHHGLAIAFHVGGEEGVGVSFTREHHGESPYIRNCYVNPGTAISGEVIGLCMNWCQGGVLEGNRVLDANVAGIRMEGTSQKARSVRDLIVRNNFFKNVPVGLAVELGAGDVIGGSGSLSRSGSTLTISDIATASLAVGDRVLLATDEPATFDGVYVITEVVDSTTFTVETTVSTSTSAGVDTVRPVYGVGRLVCEGNSIELAAIEEATAVMIQDDNDASPYPEAPDYVHGDIILRNNKVRYVDGLAPDDSGASLIDVSGAKHLIVQSNVLDTVAALPLQNRRCGHATYFNNRTPGGVLLRGWDDDLDRKYDELETEAEDALVLAMFNER